MTAGLGLGAGPGPIGGDRLDGVQTFVDARKSDLDAVVGELGLGERVEPGGDPFAGRVKRKDHHLEATWVGVARALQ